MKAYLSRTEKLLLFLTHTTCKLVTAWTTMNTSFASFFTRILPDIPRWIAFAGWYCNGYFLRKEKVVFSFTLIIEYSHFLARQIHHNTLSYYTYLPDQRIQILRLLGNLTTGLSLPAAGCWSKAYPNCRNSWLYYRKHDHLF
ncbi:MAG: hypothetical protein WC780_16340 [Lentimicrobiaceae bacterium]|jgi:hypothetical protein